MNHKHLNKHHKLRNFKHNSTVGKYLIIIVFVVLIDYFTKRTAINIVKNEGILFGLSFSNSNVIMIIASLLAAVIIFIIIFFLNTQGKLFYALILGGVIGNLIDRITLGYVIDFIRWGSWPVFNIADACISSSVVLLLVFNLAYDDSRKFRQLKNKFRD